MTKLRTRSLTLAGLALAVGIAASSGLAIAAQDPASDQTVTAGSGESQASLVKTAREKGFGRRGGTK